MGLFVRLLFDPVLAAIWFLFLITLMLNMVDSGSNYLLIHIVPKMRFVLLSVGFNRKEDFRSSFQEDRKSKEASKK